MRRGISSPVRRVSGLDAGRSPDRQRAHTRRAGAAAPIHFVADNPACVQHRTWWRDGAQLELALNGSERHIFGRRWRNAAPHMTLLHGFPSSSHDWAKVAPVLAERFELLALDFLGFGASDKPPDYAYSLGEQADLVEGVWGTEGVTATTVVAHDYAVSVTQELLARRAEGTLSTEIECVHFLNGGLYPDVHRPQPIQIALLDPEQVRRSAPNSTRSCSSPAWRRPSPPTTTRPPTRLGSGTHYAATTATRTSTC